MTLMQNKGGQKMEGMRKFTRDEARDFILRVFGKDLASSHDFAGARHAALAIGRELEVGTDKTHGTTQVDLWINEALHLLG